MNKDIAILLPYKEQYTKEHAGAASIWVKDYIMESSLKDNTIIYGNLNKKFKPFSKNFKSLDFKGTFIKKYYLHAKLYEEYLKNEFKIIEIHNRRSLNYFLKKN